MTGWQYHHLWEHARDGLPPERQPTWLVALQLVLAVAVLGGGLGLAHWAAPGDTRAAAVDRRDPAAVVHAFVRYYAARHPAACDLADAGLHAELDRQQRCTIGSSPDDAGDATTVTVLFARTCGDRHGAAAAITTTRAPAGDRSDDGGAGSDPASDTGTDADTDTQTDTSTGIGTDPAVDAPYLAVSLRRVGTHWAVTGIAPVRDRSVLRPYRCDQETPR